MPRPAVSLAPPGSVRVVCTGRGHDPVRFPPPLQLYEARDGRVRIGGCRRAEGRAPVTGPFDAADGLAHLSTSAVRHVRLGTSSAARKTTSSTSSASRLRSTRASGATTTR